LGGAPGSLIGPGLSAADGSVEHGAAHDRPYFGGAFSAWVCIRIGLISFGDAGGGTTMLTDGGVSVSIGGPPWVFGEGDVGALGGFIFCFLFEFEVPSPSTVGPTPLTEEDAASFLGGN
jgi:hypothetical protein